jgi:hypothetical protein
VTHGGLTITPVETSAPLKGKELQLRAQAAFNRQFPGRTDKAGSVFNRRVESIGNSQWTYDDNLDYWTPTSGTDAAIYRTAIAGSTDPEVLKKAAFDAASQTKNNSGMANRALQNAEQANKDAGKYANAASIQARTDQITQQMEADKQTASENLSSKKITDTQNQEFLQASNALNQALNASLNAAKLSEQNQSAESTRAFQDAEAAFKNAEAAYKLAAKQVQVDSQVQETAQLKDESQNQLSIDQNKHVSDQENARRQGQADVNASQSAASQQRSNTAADQASRNNSSALSAENRRLVREWSILLRDGTTAQRNAFKQEHPEIAELQASGGGTGYSKGGFVKKPNKNILAGIKFAMGPR